MWKKRIKLAYGTRSLTFTPLGARFTLVTLLVGIAAVNSGSNLLYLVVSMMLSMMLVSGVMSEYTLRELYVTRRLPDEIHAGRPFTVRMNVTNMKAMIPSYAIAVSARYGGGTSGPGGPGGFVLRLPPGETGGALVTETVERRGEWTTLGYEAATKFPFGLFRKAVFQPRPETRLVWPGLVKLEPEALEALSAGSGDITAKRPGRGSEVRSLRDYQLSDDARIIYWKGSAKTGRLLAREFEAEEKETVTVVLDNLVPEGGDTKAYRARFEESVCFAASLVRHIVLNLGRPAGLVTRDMDVPPGADRASYARIMDALAAVAPVGTGEGKRLDGVLANGQAAIVSPAGPGRGWSAYRSEASVYMEAGR